jgi:hypothetical protein
VGVSWKTAGNSAAEGHVRRVLAEAAADQWTVRFAWRDRDAWESDWSVNAAEWADAVDLAYYAGHAYFGGWLLTDANTGDDQALTQRTVGKDDLYGLLLGRRRLKWILVGACGPLQDRCAVLSIDNVFNWIGAFDGLRLMAGFASATSGFTDEGGRTFELARQGVPLGRAWFRAAREAQANVDAGALDGSSAPRWAALLAIESRNGSSLDDHLPGHGPDLVDVSSPVLFRALWTPT